jgi:hypothetical protein
MNARLRKVTRNRGQFPSEQAALEVLYLAVRNIEDYGVATSASGVRALQALTIYFEDESQPHDRHDHLHRRSDAPHRWAGSGVVSWAVSSAGGPGGVVP